MTAVPPSTPLLSSGPASGVGTDLRHLAPEGLCRTFALLPYAERGAVLLVAAVDPDDAVAAHVLSDVLDRPVLLVGHPESGVLRAIDTAFPRREHAETAAQRHERLWFGQLLLRNGLVSNPELEAGYAEHLAFAPTAGPGAGPAEGAVVEPPAGVTGIALGEVLVARGALSEDALVAVLAELHDLPRVSLAGVEPPPALTRLVRLDDALRLRVLPVAHAERHVVVAAARPLSPEAVSDLDRQVGRPTRVVLAARPEVEQLLAHVHGPALVDHARTAVTDASRGATGHPGHRPGEAATSWAQRLGAAAAVAGLVAAAVWAPSVTAATVAVALAVGCLLVIGHRSVLAAVALRPGRAEDADLPLGVLPTYSVLVAVDDAGVSALPGLLASVEALDYPRSRLEVLLLCEESDLVARQAVRATPLPPTVRVVVVPDSHPVGPAKARNVALQLARGEMVVALDVRDRPEPQQLRRVAARLAADPTVACVQAELHHDAQGGLVAGWAASALAVRSTVVQRASAAHSSVVLLSETSHHLPTALLRRLGGWDAFSLTPGAELGVRLRRTGHVVDVVPSTTWTPPPTGLAAWLRATAHRWGGLSVTALRHARRPRRLVADVGIRTSACLLLCSAAGLGVLLTPALVVAASVWAGLHWLAPAVLAPQVEALGVVSLLVVTAAAVGSAYLALASSLRLGRQDLVRPALLAPVSWLLVSAAPFLAVTRMVLAPATDRSAEVCP